MHDVVIRNATIYTGEIGGVIRGDLLIHSDEIAALGKKVEAPADATVVDAAGAPVVPGYVDIHCHGADGAAFDDGPEAVAGIIAAHRAHGTTYQAMSLVTDAVEVMARLIGELAPLVAKDPHLVGIHPEGPFLHPQFKGAHPEDLLRDPERSAVAELLGATPGAIAQFTLAPEKPGGLEAVRALVERGVPVSVGHSAATYEDARNAFDAGARILTHAFNGMRGIHHRAPGPVLAALRDDRIWLEVINDTIHVHPAVVRSLFLEAPERVILVTDAMSATCSPDGDYMLGTLPVRVVDGIARLKDGDSLAGSTLTMDRAVANAVKKVGASLDVAVAAATSHPARAVGADDVAGRLEPGRQANLNVLDPQTLLPTSVYIDGRPLPNAA